MIAPPVDLSGQRFGHLLVLHYHHKTDDNKRAGWLCRCDCGRTTIIRSNALTHRGVKSCGCANTQAMVAHNLAKAERFTFEGESKTLSEWAKDPRGSNVPPRLMRVRMLKGWSFREAFLVPVRAFKWHT